MPVCLCHSRYRACFYCPANDGNKKALKSVATMRNVKRFLPVFLLSLFLASEQEPALNLALIPVFGVRRRGRGVAN